jgi:hypothetical protein
MVYVVVDHLSRRQSLPGTHHNHSVARHSHNQVDPQRHSNSKPAVCPKQPNHAPLQPPPYPRHADAVLTDIHHDDAETHNRGGDEEGFGRVHKRSAKGARVQVEACRYQSDDENEQADVEEKEDAADCVDATEAERDCIVFLALHRERGEGIERKEQERERERISTCV